MICPVIGKKSKSCWILELFWGKITISSVSVVFVIHSHLMSKARFFQTWHKAFRNNLLSQLKTWVIPTLANMVELNHRIIRESSMN